MMRKSKKTAGEIRRENLTRYMRAKGLSNKQVAEDTGHSVGYISQIKTGQPTKDGTPRTVSERFAEKFEDAYDLQRGWLSADHEGRSIDIAETIGIKAKLDHDALEMARRISRLPKPLRAILGQQVASMELLIHACPPLKNVKHSSEFDRHMQYYESLEELGRGRK